MDALSILGEITVRSSLALGMALALAASMGRGSAANRHLVLMLALLLVAMLPLVVSWGPRLTWKVAMPVKAIAALPPVVESSAQITPPDLKTAVVTTAPVAAFPAGEILPAAFIGLLIAGSLAQAVVLIRAVRTWRSIRCRAHAAHLPRAAEEIMRRFAAGRPIPPLLVSSEVAVPVLAGFLRPAILLPERMKDAPDGQLAMALCHELAHYFRGDALLAPLHAWLRIVYWWHPLVWLARARLRREREAACDDAVLRGNFRASDYARLIVEAAQRLQAGSISCGALAMASTPHVADRVREILDPARNRRPASRRMLIVGGFAALALGSPLTALQVEAVKEVTKPDPVAGMEKPQIELGFKLIEIPETTYQRQRAQIDAAVENSDVVTLLKVASAALSSPSVTTKEGLQANVDIVHDFPYATRAEKNSEGKIVESGFKNRELGLKITATPRLAADGRAVNVEFDAGLVSFAGWTSSGIDGARLPSFSARRIRTSRLVALPAMSVMWLGEEAQDASPIMGTGPVRLVRTVFVFTAKKIEPPSRAKDFSRQPKDVLVRLSFRFFQVGESIYGKHPGEMEQALASGALGSAEIFSDYIILAEPTALVKPGEPCVMEAMHSGDFPAAYTRQADGRLTASQIMDRHTRGIQVALKQKLTQGGVDLNFVVEITKFAGLVRDKTKVEQPVFDTSRFNVATLLGVGKTCGMWLEKDVPDLDAAMKSSMLATDSPRVRVGVTISADLYTRDGVKISSQ